jgi:hypothetical protein
MEISDGAIIKCSHDSYVKVVNKSSLQSETPVERHHTIFCWSADGMFPVGVITYHVNWP